MAESGSVKPLRPFPPLQRGDRVALIAPSSHQGRLPVSFVPDAISVLEGWGLEVAPLPKPERRHLYLAGTDAERAEEFQRHYLDPEIKALFATRGGYGCARMLPLLDTQAIAQAAPKPLVGFSDVTALMAYLHTVAGVQTVHGPNLATAGALTAERRGESLESLHRALFHPAEERRFSLQYLAGRPWSGEPIEGVLLGGCLSVWAGLAGTPWLPPTGGAVLMFEDVGEAPYRLDRVLTQLRLADAFADIRAMVFGYFTDCAGEGGHGVSDMLLDLFENSPFPVFHGLPFGHDDPNLAVTLGAAVQIAQAGSHALPELRVG